MATENPGSSDSFLQPLAEKLADSGEIPSPLVENSVDIRNFIYMPLEVLRLRDSELSSDPNAEVFRCAVLSWCASWHQVPAASLPDDDVALARLLGFGRDLKGWKKLRANGGLRGWIKCSDGRLYHPVVAEKALEAWHAKSAQRARTEAARTAREQARQTQLQEMLHAQSHTHATSVTDDVTASKGREGKGREGKVNLKAEGSEEKPARTPNGVRLLPEWVLPKTWGEWALKEKPTWDANHVRIVAENFRDHFISTPGQKGRKADWLATWRVWVRREQSNPGGNGKGNGGSSTTPAPKMCPGCGKLLRGGFTHMAIGDVCTSCYGDYLNGQWDGKGIRPAIGH